MNRLSRRLVGSVSQPTKYGISLTQIYSSCDYRQKKAVSYYICVPPYYIIDPPISLRCVRTSYAL